MILLHSIFVAGIPRPQQRPRAARVGQFVKIYSPKTEWDTAVLKAAFERRPPAGRITGRIWLRLIFTMPMPKRLLWRDYHICRPDIDNLSKSVMDSLGRAKWFRDDCQIYKLDAEKYYDITPGVKIILRHGER